MKVKELEKRKQLGTYRSLKIQHNLSDFASNDYLGLARSATLKKALINECQTWKESSTIGLGSTGSRLFTGNNHYIQSLESSIAKFHGFDQGLIFNCGYMANVGLIQAVTSEEDAIFYDVMTHESTLHGIKISKAKAYPFRHNNLAHIEERLKKISVKGNRFICIESIYSTRGSLAPLLEIYRLAQKYDAKMIVDEAHAVGVFGFQGKGLVQENGLSGKIFAQVVGFGKALGVFGAIVLGSHQLKDVLVNYAKTCIYTTALPYYALAAIKCSYENFPLLDKKREKLKSLIQVAGFTKTPIQIVKALNNSHALQLVDKAAKKGFDVRAFLSPSVQRGKECLRICLHVFNETQELLKLLSIVGEYA